MSKHALRWTARWREAAASSWKEIAEFRARRFFDGGQSVAASHAPPESGAVLFLLGLLIFITVGAALIGIFDLDAMPEQASDFDPPLDWPVVVCVFALIIEGVQIAMVRAENRSRRSAESLSRESEDRMTVALDCADVGLWRWNRPAGLIWLSDFALHLLNLPLGFVATPEAFGEYIHPDDRAAVGDAINRAIGDDRNDSRTYEIVYRFVTPAGVTRWLRMRGRARRIGVSLDYELAGTVADITNTKEMQAEIERQRVTLLHLSRVSVLSELSGALAHELKQPLTAIMSNAQAAQRLLDRDPIDFKELRDAISDIVNDDARAGAVIAHLRSLLKRESLERGPVDLNGAVLAALELSLADLTQRGITVVHKPAARHLLLSGDQIQLQQLLLNLIANASEAMAEQHGGTLLIVTDMIGGREIHLAISDTGTGIATDLLARLFDPLVTTKPHGLGLGLSISRAIADAHGGRIWATNNPGRGATFHVQFPVLEEKRQ